MQLELEHIENEMDVRVESLIEEIHRYRVGFMLQLNKYKKDFEE